MLKRTVVIAGTMAVMLLSGCSLMGGASKEEMESVIAERDYYVTAYDDELDYQSEIESEIDELEYQVSELEDERDILAEALDDLGGSSANSDEIKTAEDYYGHPMIQKELDELVEGMKVDYADVYSDLGIEVSGNTFTYWFQYKTQFDNPDAIAQQLEAALTDEMLEGVVTDVEAECGVSGITCCYIYYNADGSIIYQDSYTK